MKKFFKFNILIALFFSLFLSKVFANAINSIKIEGNDRIPDETIIMFSNVKIGEVIDSDKTKFPPVFDLDSKAPSSSLLSNRVNSFYMFL